MVPSVTWGPSSPKQAGVGRGAGPALGDRSTLTTGKGASSGGAGPGYRGAGGGYRACGEGADWRSSGPCGKGG